MRCIFVLIAYMSLSSAVQAQVEGDVCGDGTSSVIFLHDQLQDSTAFLGAWQTICSAPNVRAIRYDRRGYGQSPASDEPYSDLSDLASIVQSLNLDQVTLVGSGIGAGLALEFTLQNPTRVNGLVLSNPSSAGSALQQNSDAVKTITVPALVLVGANSSPDIIASGQAIGGSLPNSDTVVMLSAGQYIEIERPGAFANSVVSFVSSLATDRDNE